MWPAPWSILSEPFKLRWFDIADPTRPGSKVNSTSCGSSSFHHLQSLWCPRQLALVSMTTAASAVACSVLDVKMEERYEHKVPLPLFLLPSFPQVNLPHTHTGWSKWIKKKEKNEHLFRLQIRARALWLRLGGYCPPSHSLRSNCGCVLVWQPATVCWSQRVLFFFILMCYST